MKAHYRKHNDGSCNSSTYHKKDGTPVRARLKREAQLQIRESAVDAVTQAADPKRLDG